jgi:hypothetical protein
MTFLGRFQHGSLQKRKSAGAGTESPFGGKTAGAAAKSSVDPGLQAALRVIFLSAGWH